jgi:uroporphyrin-III C-methyltransferase/precorrin-2 dehydrogenase/sirohydrochlorin ferrochelatase
VLAGDLGTLPGIVRDGDVKPPTLIIIGEVVRLRERLKWFEPAGAAGEEITRADSG